MTGLLEFTKELFTQIVSGAGSFIDIATAQRGWGFGYFLLTLLWLLSGFASFEFANTTGMNGKKHFWFGLLLPVVYPLILLIRKLVIQAKAVSAAKRETERIAAERDQIEAERRRIDATPNKDNFAKLKGSSDAAKRMEFYQEVGKLMK